MATWKWKTQSWYLGLVSLVICFFRDLIPWDEKESSKKTIWKIWNRSCFQPLQANRSKSQGIIQSKSKQLDFCCGMGLHHTVDGNQKSCVHSPVELGSCFPLFTKVLFTSAGGDLRISEPSLVWTPSIIAMWGWEGLVRHSGCKKHSGEARYPESSDRSWGLIWWLKCHLLGCPVGGFVRIKRSSDQWIITYNPKIFYL